MIHPGAVVDAARGWLGVPFAHQGRSRAGVDCAGLVIMVARGLGLLPEDFDVNGYRRAPDGTMRAACDQHLLRVAAPRLGGVALLRFEHDPQHLAVLVDYRHGGLALLHALQKSGRVTEHRLDALWRSRIVQAYAFPGVS